MLDLNWPEAALGAAVAFAVAIAICAGMVKNDRDSARAHELKMKEAVQCTAPAVKP